MMDNSSLQLSIHRLRSNARDHGFGSVKAAWSQSGVRTREARPFFFVRTSRESRVRRITISVPILAITSLTG